MRDDYAWYTPDMKDHLKAIDFLNDFNPWVDAGCSDCGAKDSVLINWYSPSISELGCCFLCATLWYIDWDEYGGDTLIGCPTEKLTYDEGSELQL